MDLLIIGGLAVAATAYSWLHGNKAWKNVAEQVDLIYTKSVLGGKKLHGHLRGFDVQVEEVSDNNRGSKILVKIMGVNPTFTLGRDSAFQRMIKPDIETGDQLFDERTRIEGDPDWALALLGPDARRLTEIMVTGWEGALKGGTLSASFKKIGDTASTLDTLLDLAQLLRLPAYAELPKLLMERARHDPSSAVRFQAFRRLTSSNAFRKEAVAVAKTLLDSPSSFLKLEACRLLLRPGTDKSDRASQELVALATHRQVESSVRRSALEMLIHSPPHRATAISVMSRILQRPDAPQVRTAALEGLIRAGAKAELLEIQADGEAEAEILARGLGLFDASAQPKLLELLEHSGDRARMAAVKSLDDVGDLKAIAALRQVAGRDRLFKSSLAKQAEKAIESIKGRSGGSQQGEISIITVAPLEGAVSSADDAEAGGEVSLTS